MKVCICSLNSQYIHSSLAPWCLRAGLKAYGDPALDVSVLEGTVNEHPAVIAQRIADASPDILGFCCYIWNISRIYALLPAVKKALPRVTIALGGPEVGYCAEAVLADHPEADFVLTGEGEQSFALLCNALLHRQEPAVAGVTRRTEHGLVSLPEQPLPEEPPSPYCEEYFAALNGRIAYLETSRGCPYACAYCLSARCGNLRFYSVERAERELLLLANSGTKTVKLVDRTFNAHRSRAKELFRFILGHYGKGIPKGVCFHFEIAGDLLDEETVALLSSAPPGLIQLEIGVQSFHEQTLSYIRRKTDLAKLTGNIRRLLEKQNLHVHIDLIAGLPLEDFSAFGESVNKAFALQPHMLQLGFLKLLHGAPMREDTQRYPCRFNPLPPYEVLSTPVLSEGELARLHRAEWALDKLYNSGRFSRSLAYGLEATGMTPFDLFLAFGEGTALGTGASLDEVAQAFFRFALNRGADEEALRNHMVCDRLERVRGGKLPAFLQKPDERLSLFRKRLRSDPATAPKKGVPRGTALLYHPLRGVYADYDTPHPVTGKVPLHCIPLE